MPLDEPLTGKSRGQSLLGRLAGFRASRSVRDYLRWQALTHAEYRLRDWLKPAFISSRSEIAAHWYLSVPMLMIIGIAAYFALPIEPPVWAGPLGFIFILTGVIAWGVEETSPWRARAKLSLIGLLVVLAGFSVIQIRTSLVSAPMLPLDGREEVGPITTSAKLIAAEPRDGRVRMVLAPTEFEGRERDQEALAGLKRIRVTMPGSYAVPTAGSQVELRAILRPPPGPSYPGGYAFRRDLYFQQIGAVGFAIGEPVVTAAPNQGVEWSEYVDGLRFSITEQILEVLPGETGAVAAALVTGQRGGIGDETLSNIRDAGISHLLAISGLHLGVVAAWLFFCVRVPLAAVPSIALRFPLKKISALVALVGTAIYLVIAGMPTPTIRAFLMVAMGIGAIWLDRDPFSLRLVGIAALIIIFARPEVVMGPSFQMSFAAVTGLIACYQGLEARGLFAHSTPDRRLRTKFARFLLGLMLTTVIASAATAPFAIWHFQHVASFGLIGNLVGVPLASLWIIPLGLVALITMPLGLADWPLIAMGSGIDLMLVMAADIAALPYAALDTPSLMPALFAVLVVGLILGLARLLPWGWLVACLAGVLLVSGPWEAKPLLMAKSDGDLIGVYTEIKGDQRYLLLSQTRRDRFTAEMWRRHLAGPAIAKWGRLPDAVALNCDGDGCSMQPGLSIALTLGALVEDCGRVPTILLPFHVHRNRCQSSLVIDRYQLADSAGLAIYPGLNGEGHRIETVGKSLGDRPWSGLSQDIGS